MHVSCHKGSAALFIQGVLRTWDPGHHPNVRHRHRWCTDWFHLHMAFHKMSDIYFCHFLGLKTEHFSFCGGEAKETESKSLSAACSPGEVLTIWYNTKWIGTDIGIEVLQSIPGQIKRDWFCSSSLLQEAYDRKAVHRSITQSIAVSKSSYSFVKLKENDWSMNIAELSIVFNSSKCH